jgi:hypothetical protein
LALQVSKSKRLVFLQASPIQQNESKKDFSIWVNKLKEANLVNNLNLPSKFWLGKRIWVFFAVALANYICNQ